MKEPCRAAANAGVLRQLSLSRIEVLSDYEPGSFMKSLISDPEALFLNAERYEEQGKFKMAFRCLLDAANLGHTSSQVNLGNFYSAGKGVRKSSGDASYWYQRAYNGGDPTGALNLAIDRRNEGNTRSAFVWFKRAWAMNEGDAAIELAKLYAVRRGGAKKAIELLKKIPTLKRSEISDDSKEEAALILSELIKGEKRKRRVSLRPSG